jgi:hypothetical protein
MSYEATIVPIDWDEFMDLLSAIDALPGAPGPELGECVWQAIGQVPEQHYVFGYRTAGQIIEELESIRFSPQHRRDLRDIFAKLFNWHFQDEIGWEKRYYDFTKIELDVHHSLCSPQDVRAIHDKLTELAPVLEQQERKAKEIIPALTWGNFLRLLRGEKPLPTEEQKREANDTPYIFHLTYVIQSWCEKYSREGKGIFTYWI